VDPRTLQAIQRLNAAYRPELIEAMKRFRSISQAWRGVWKLYQPSDHSQLTPTSEPIHPVPKAEPPKAEPTRAPWSVETDPGIPESFKEVYREMLGTEEQFLTRELTAKSYSLDVCAVCEYVKLRRRWSEQNSEPDLFERRKIVWENICVVHEKIFHCRPTQPARLFKRLGLLEALPVRRGRPSQE
jgi:hypothetical protein